MRLTFHRFQTLLCAVSVLCGLTVACPDRPVYAQDDSGDQEEWLKSQMQGIVEGVPSTSTSSDEELAKEQKRILKEQRKAMVFEHRQRYPEKHLSDAADEQLISLDFKEADIQVVLQALAQKAGINIVTSQEVIGNINVRLKDVTLDQALNTITKTYGFAYEKDGNVIMVGTLEEIKARREAMKELVEIEPVITKVIQLRFLDAADAEDFLEPQLSPRGRISILEMTGQKGWAFGTAKYGKATDEKQRKRIQRESARSKAIVITDTPTTIERLEKVLAKVDVLPQQILIEAKAMEVARDLLRDINLGAVTGATAGSTSLSVANQAGSKQSGASLTEFAGGLLQSSFTPSAFQPSTTGLTAAAAGAQFFFQKMRGTQFAALLELLEEDVRTNTLSSPNVVTLSGQEARILVGEKYPILKTEVAGTTTTTTTTTLDYYQNIGIELYVVPSVAGDDHISMLIHPVVSARVGTVGTNAYPIINTRETETQVVVEKGDTIVIGGLLKDAKIKSRIGLPFLGKLPVFGPLFARSTEDVAKIDLLIFMTARVLEPGMISPEEMQKLEEQYQKFLSEQIKKNGQEALASSSAVPVTSTPTEGNKGVLYQKP
ncbi:MAG: secretin and TonB N-terminal domain-containing protein [Candidatus Omnitrophica bacterium]|nr:secretin and TonB N-terminal domain-containing protein [Candidatus Omnitrophota bacterium]